MTILQYINSNFKPVFESIADLPFTVTKREFEKGEIITSYGQIEQKAYFLINGSVEVTILHEREEKILDFIFPNSFFCSYTSFLLQQPSDVQIAALTSCEVEVINYSELQNAYNTSLLANQLGRVVTENLYIKNTNREKDLLTKSTEERYMELLSKRADIIQMIPVNKIAKYLGVHPDSLSRIRKKIIF
jgi:CRP-like cAMP-binding protein